MVFSQHQTDTLANLQRKGLTNQQIIEWCKNKIECPRLPRSTKRVTGTKYRNHAIDHYQGIIEYLT